MADATWLANTTGKSSATLASGTELRVIDDPAGTPTSKKTTIGAIRSFILGLANTWTQTQTFANIVVGSSNLLAWSTDLFLARDGANTLALRNSTSAQALQIYNTYTDASNYERGFARWSSNVLLFGTESAGTGSARGMKFQSASTSTSDAFHFLGTGNTIPGIKLEGSDGRNIVLRPGSSYLDCIGYYKSAQGTADRPGMGFTNANATITFGYIGNSNNTADVLSVWSGSPIRTSGSGAAFELMEMTAPAAAPTNSVRIYAEDNGSGKTRLMALFPSGAAQQIAIEP